MRVMVVVVVLGLGLLNVSFSSRSPTVPRRDLMKGQTCLSRRLVSSIRLLGRLMGSEPRLWRRLLSSWSGASVADAFVFEPLIDLGVVRLVS